MLELQDKGNTGKILKNAVENGIQWTKGAFVLGKNIFSPTWWKEGGQTFMYLIDPAKKLTKRELEGIEKLNKESDHYEQSAWKCMDAIFALMHLYKPSKEFEKKCLNEAQRMIIKFYIPGKADPYAQKYKTEEESYAKKTQKQGEFPLSFVDMFFNTYAEFYEYYLKYPEYFPNLVRDHFEKLKNKGIKLEDINHENEAWRNTVEDLLTWQKRLEHLSPDELQNERGNLLWRYLAILFNQDKTDSKLYERIISFYKFLKTIEEDVERKNRGD